MADYAQAIKSLIPGANCRIAFNQDDDILYVACENVTEQELADVGIFESDYSALEAEKNRLDEIELQSQDPLITGAWMELVAPTEPETDIYKIYSRVRQCARRSMSLQVDVSGFVAIFNSSILKGENWRASFARIFDELQKTLSEIGVADLDLNASGDAEKLLYLSSTSAQTAEFSLDEIGKIQDWSDRNFLGLTLREVP